VESSIVAYWTRAKNYKVRQIGY